MTIAMIKSLLDACYQAKRIRDLLPPLEQFDADEIQLDRAAQRTLRNCMQEVVLDGPKRDRRLWLGDLRLEAQVNAVTFRNFDLFERCIYLLAAFPLADGQIPACIFDKPQPYGCRCVLSDYSFLFSDLLLLHYQETGNRKLLEAMYPLAKKTIRPVPNRLPEHVFRRRHPQNLH